MKSKTVIVSEQHRARVISIIKSLPLDVVHEVIIDEYKRDISAEQRGLYFTWVGIIANALGESKEAIHKRYKDRFLTLVFEKNPKRHESYCASVQACRELWRKGMKDDATFFKKQIDSFITIRDANVKEMSEYMQDIENEAASLAIRLPHPDERGI